VAYGLPRCCLFSLWLAFGAEVGTAVADDYPFNSGTADGAELTTQAVGNLELEVGGARCTVRTEVGINAGAFIANG